MYVYILQSMMEGRDTDNDGQISFEEFKEMMKFI